MRNLLRSLGTLFLAAGVAFGAPAAEIGAHVLPAESGISLHGPGLALSPLDLSLPDSAAIADPGRPVAASVAEAVAPAAAPVDAAGPAVAATIEAGPGTDAALVAQAVAHPENVLSAGSAATLRALMGGVEADAAAPSAGKDWSKVDPKILLDPAQRPTVSFGPDKYPVLSMPTLGDDVAQLWSSAQAQSAGTLISMYNFDDMDIANAVVAAAKHGHKQVIIGDYSNWFPVSAQTPAMRLVLANLGPHLELHILKGLSSIGIEHAKFTLFTAANGDKMLQVGSFNYTKTSQLNHWENLAFTKDPDRLSFFVNLHAWMLRRSRPYAPDLKPLDPVFDPKDPIPQDPSRSLVFHDTPFPKSSGSPNGGSEDRLVEAETLVQQSLDILMFAPFPTPRMVAAIEALLAKGIPVRMIADAGEIGNARHILDPLLQKGMKLYSIVGPDVILRHLPWTQASKMHMKVMIFDGAMADAIAKMCDSLNISLNAMNHNFEDTGFWQGFHAAFMQAYFNMMLKLATPVDAAALAKTT